MLDRDALIARLKQENEALRREVESQRPLAAADADVLRDEWQLRDFFENAVIGLHWVDAKGKILWANRAELEMLGYTAEEYIGHHIGEFHADSTCIADILRRLTANETIRNYEAPLRRKDGAIRHVLISSSVLFHDGEFLHTRCFTKDVTERRHAQIELHRREQQLRLIIDALPALVGYIDTEQRFRWVNRAYTEWFGRSSDELIGAEVAESFGEAAYAKLQPRIEAALTGTAQSFDTEMSRAGEEEPRIVHVSYCPDVGPNDEVAGYVALYVDVTPQLKAAKELRESERKLRAVFDNALDSILIADDDGRIVEANASAAQLLGRAPEAILGALIPSFSQSPAPSDVDALWAAFTSQGSQRGELDIVRPDGTIRLAEYAASASFVTGRHLSVLRDITDRRRAEDSVRFLADASATLASSLDYEKTLAVVAQLAVPRIADWAAVDMLGRTGAIERIHVAHSDPEKVKLAHELALRWPFDPTAVHGVPHVIRSAEPEIYYDISDEVLEAATIGPEQLEVVRALGLRSSMCVPLIVRGKPVGAISLVSAESGRRYTERDFVLAQDLARRASLAIENALSYREAKDASKLKDEFLATVSHELRTPLTAILGWATMLRARLSDPAYVHKGLETIQRNARAQSQLIDDLLDLSRVITGKLRLDVQPVDLTEVVTSAVETIRPAAAAKGITVSQVLDPHANTIMGDVDRLVQLVNNLLTNAVKFTHKGGRIHVYQRKVDSSIEIVVQDNGEGIAPDFLPFVFERFRQANQSMSRPHGGLGLGLAISKSLVEMHGGTIEASSEGVGKGATFTVRLPISPLRSRQAGAEESRPLPEAPGFDFECDVSIEGRDILCVDDEADTRDLLVALLEHCKANVVACASTASALDLLSARKFDLVISDIGMPGEDGYALIRKLRALDESQGRRTPAVALTAYATSADRTRALMAGYHAHIAKPVEPSELVVCVAHVLQHFSGE